jgi:hypothetical protein
MFPGNLSLMDLGVLPGREFMLRHLLEMFDYVNILIRNH